MLRHILNVPTHRSESQHTLIVIDVQQAFDNDIWGQRNNPLAEQSSGNLIQTWRSQNSPIIPIQHLNPKPESIFNPREPGFQFKGEAVPQGGEPIFNKSVNSAFIGTNLEAHLRASSVTAVVIVGITTDHCISTTTRMAGNLGFDTFIVSDATATFERTGPDGRHWSAEVMHDTALASLNKEFATVVKASDVMDAIAHS